MKWVKPHKQRLFDVKRKVFETYKYYQRERREVEKERNIQQRTTTSFIKVRKSMLVAYNRRTKIIGFSYRSDCVLVGHKKRSVF